MRGTLNHTARHEAETLGGAVRERQAFDACASGSAAPFVPRRARGVAVRGGAVCSAGAQPLRPVTERGGAPRSGFRLTRRGRVVLIGVPLFLAVAVGGVAGAGLAAAAATAPVAAPHTVTITVAAGESLWDIAERIAPNDDPRDVIYAIQQANGLTGSGVRAGQRVRIPSEYAADGRING